MTPQEIKTAMLQLSEALATKLQTIPIGQTADYFTPEEQAELELRFGAEWPFILGLVA